MSREQLLATTFVELADTLTGDFDVLDFLQHLTVRSADLLDATAAALILADQRGDLQLVASTTHAVEVLGLMAIATRQGPCQDAFHRGAPEVNVPRPKAERRWPDFMRNADQLGFRTVQVLPLNLRGTVLGALSLLYVEAEVLDADAFAIGQALTSVATIGLQQEHTTRQQVVLAQHLQTAIQLRVTIEQAKGVVAELAGCGVEEAFDVIERYSRTRRRSLGDVAGQVVRGTLGLDRLRSDAS